jgi:hypothetical protein
MDTLGDCSSIPNMSTDPKLASAILRKFRLQSADSFILAYVFLAHKFWRRKGAGVFNWILV